MPPRAGRALLAALLLLLAPGCATLGLALAEDVTRLAGTLTGQQQAADALADKLAGVREAQAQFDLKLELQAAQATAAQAKAAKALDDELETAKAGEIPESVLVVGTALLSLLLDWVNNLRRDRAHAQKDRTLLDGIGAALERRPRRRRGSARAARGAQ